MIRKAILEDLESIVSIEQTFGAEALSKRSLRHFILSKNLVLVSIDPITKIKIAYCIILLRPNTNKARVYSFAVAEQARGKGHGKQMLEAVEEYCHLLNRNQITLEVRTNNLTAFNLYKSFGFQITKTLKSYYSNGVDGYHMKKIVDNPAK